MRRVASLWENVFVVRLVTVQVPLAASGMTAGTVPVAREPVMRPAADERSVACSSRYRACEGDNRRVVRYP